MQQQVHSKFKVFVTSPDSNGGIPSDFHLTMNGFIALSKIAVKSVSVEYLHNSAGDEIVISLGYVDDQESYAVSLKSVNFGPLAKKEGQSLSDELEKALSANSDDSVICHELFVNKNNEFVGVFLRAVK